MKKIMIVRIYLFLKAEGILFKNLKRIILLLTFPFLSAAHKIDNLNIVPVSDNG